MPNAQPLPKQWAEYAPDQSDYNGNVSDNILNVVPVGDGYGSLPSWGAYSTSALSGAPKGAFFVRKEDGSTAIYGGTTTTLERLNPATYVFDDVTRTTGGDYACPTSNQWQFRQFGSYLIAVNGSDAPQYIDFNSGTNFAALSNAPAGAKHICVAADFVVMGNTTYSSREVIWSGVNDSTHWTGGQKGSDSQILPDGGAVTGLVGYQSGFVAFQQDKIHLFERASGIVFSRRVLHEQLGCIAPYSVVQTRDQFYWYGTGGFYMGVEATPIGQEKVNRFVERNVSALERTRMVSMVDPPRKMIWWSMLASDGTRMMIGYHWPSNKWTRSNTTVSYIFPAVSPGYTFDTWDDLSSTFDGLPYTYDSDVWTGGGAILMAGFKSDGSFGFFDGLPMEATLETSDISIDTGNYGFVNAFRVVGDASASYVYGQVAGRHIHGDALSWTDEQAANTSTGRIFVRKRGMTHRFRARIAQSSWKNTDGVIPYVKAAGRR